MMMERTESYTLEMAIRDPGDRYNTMSGSRGARYTIMLGR